jgi:hypothetical protein
VVVLIDHNEWKNNSKKGLVCGIILCRNSPIKQCPKCLLHYCSEHVKTHFHPTATSAVSWSETDDNLIIKAIATITEGFKAIIEGNGNGL